MERTDAELRCPLAKLQSGIRGCNKLHRKVSQLAVVDTDPTFASWRLALARVSNKKKELRCFIASELQLASTASRGQPGRRVLRKG